MGDEGKQFGLWLDGVMRQRRLSQAELARAVGVADAQVSRWRRGQVVPTVRYLQQIADVIGVQRSTLDRLAGYPVSGPLAQAGEDNPATEAEIAEYQARFAQLLRGKVPPAMWRAYVDACEGLADGLASSLRNVLDQAGENAGEHGGHDDQGSRPPEREMGFRR